MSETPGCRTHAQLEACGGCEVPHRWWPGRFVEVEVAIWASWLSLV